MRILITGGTGFVGQALCRLLAKAEHSLAVVSRNPERAERALGAQGITVTAADTPLAFKDWQPEAIVNLAGESIAGRRWSDAHKRELRESRLNITEHLVMLCEQLAVEGHPPQVMVSGSAMGYYGAQPKAGQPGDVEIDEQATPHDDFNHRLCRDWEAAAMPVTDSGVRLAIIRIGLVMEADGGTLAKLLTPFRFGLGGRLGDGRHYMPWIHRHDLIRIIERLLTDTTLSGAFNASAPHPVTNMGFTHALARALGRPAILPLPATALKLGLGEMSTLLLEGARMVPARLEEAGFRFDYPTLDVAFADILGKD
ncbi:MULTISPECIES: TIGR01777 family oxidoreductase [Cobetia]|uniref:TIGR01777 family protein n=1 Tax=Cobetia crustatorum TaxID=553385 RepID=A0A558HEX9_9GAMM|nr:MULTISPECIES: TIGR01777 family oxidoreductase [Cobetia]TVU67664.1 TIGR01777 family protein [Cobetia crustatorum]